MMIKYKNINTISSLDLFNIYSFTHVLSKILAENYNYNLLKLLNERN